MDTYFEDLESKKIKHTRVPTYLWDSRSSVREPSWIQGKYPGLWEAMGGWT